MRMTGIEMARRLGTYYSQVQRSLSRLGLRVENPSPKGAYDWETFEAVRRDLAPRLERQRRYWRIVGLQEWLREKAQRAACRRRRFRCPTCRRARG